MGKTTACLDKRVHKRGQPANRYPIYPVTIANTVAVVVAVAVAVAAVIVAVAVVAVAVLHDLPVDHVMVIVVDIDVAKHDEPGFYKIQEPPYEEHEEQENH